GSRPPIREWAVWSLIVLGGLFGLIGVYGLLFHGAAPPEGETSGMVFSLLFGAGLSAIGFRLLPITRSWRARSPRVNPSSCHCAEVARIAGPQADQYAARHLHDPVPLTQDGITRLR